MNKHTCGENLSLKLKQTLFKATKEKYVIIMLHVGNRKKEKNKNRKKKKNEIGRKFVYSVIFPIEAREANGARRRKLFPDDLNFVVSEMKVLCKKNIYDEFEYFMSRKKGRERNLFAVRRMRKVPRVEFH